jgi:hypothetical protein
LLIFQLQLPNALLLGGERFANAWLAVLLSAVLRQPAPDRGLADVHAFADVLDAQTLLFDHPDHFQFQGGIECFTFSCCHALTPQVVDFPPIEVSG